MLFLFTDVYAVVVVVVEIFENILTETIEQTRDLTLYSYIITTTTRKNVLRIV